MRWACNFWTSAWTAASRTSARRSVFVWVRRGGSPAVPADTSTSRERGASQGGERQRLTRRVVVRAGLRAGAFTGDLLHPSSYDRSNDVSPRPRTGPPGQQWAPSWLAGTNEQEGLPWKCGRGEAPVSPYAGRAELWSR